MNKTLELSSPHIASIDALRTNRAHWSTQILGIVGFALLTAVGAQIRIYLWEVPFSLQTVAVYGSGLYLGWRNGALSQILYLALGLIAPVFAGPDYGVLAIIGAVSGGYLIAFPVSSAIVGALSEKWKSLPGSMLSMVAGSIVLFTAGVTWLHFAAGHADWFTSIDHGWLRFIPADLAKILAVGLTYTATRTLTRSDA